MPELTNKARQLLGEREPHLLYGNLGIGDGEETLSHARLLEFLKAYPVVKVSIGHNNYGEFQFVYCKVMRYGQEDCITFWGNGYHEYRGVMLVNWNYDIGNAFLVRGLSTMTKKEVLMLITERRNAMGITSKAKQEKSGNLFETVSDLMDDDAAYSELEM